jgi:muramoyltetrapeptide carboxypeptidase LdcA involved in peptidoglycan recycling
MRLAGFFDGAAAILVGRTGAKDEPSLTQHEAVHDALGMLGVPLVADVEFGHVPPQLTIVNGALGRVRFDADEQYLEQTLA